MITRDTSDELVRSAVEYDVGLATFLLGIHTEQQASRDPLRGSLIDYAQLVKLYGAENTGSDRYSPPRVTETVSTPINGNPDPLCADSWSS